MARLLGDNLLPDSVVSRRRQFRERVSDLRQPVRQFRERNVPGPDLVGTAEEQLTSLRNSIISRDSVLNRIRSRSSTPDSSGDSESGSESSSNGSAVNQMT